jgi:uncharacterized protein with von Willebrand factor type A (vWA) domain
MERVTGTYKASVWLDPVPEPDWDHTQSIRMMRARAHVSNHAGRLGARDASW